MGYHSALEKERRADSGHFPSSYNSYFSRFVFVALFRQFQFVQLSLNRHLEITSIVRPCFSIQTHVSRLLCFFVCSCKLKQRIPQFVPDCIKIRKVLELVLPGVQPCSSTLMDMCLYQPRGWIRTQRATTGGVKVRVTTEAPS